jgi:hypothetical protein
LVEGIKTKTDENAARTRATVEAIRGTGITSLLGIVNELNRRRILTPRGGKWHASNIKNLLVRLG